jgi:hypothetical protein
VLERKRREDDEVQRMLELTEAREATAKVAAELQVYKDAEAEAARLAEEERVRLEEEAAAKAAKKKKKK